MRKTRHPGTGIAARVRIIVPDERRAEALEMLQSLVGPTRVAPGCLGCSVYEDLERRGRFTLEELWQDEAALTRRVRSEEYRKILALMEISSERPKVSFQEIRSRGGMEIVTELREME